MDPTQGYALGGFLTAFVGVTGYLIKLNHHRIRSTCCNKVCVSSIDVEATTPPDSIHEPKEELKITIPPP